MVVDRADDSTAVGRTAVRRVRLHLATGIGMVVVLAIGLRLWGIGFGLPYDITADEPHHIIQALKIGAGEGGPLVRMWHTVGKGGLDYILFIEYAALYGFWWLTGQVHGPRDFALAYLQDPTAFYLIGRVTVAMLGAVTCWCVYLAGTRMYNARIGVGAAFLGAVAYYHSADSHIINVHIPMAFALWASLASYLVYERDARLRWLVLAGALCGAAIALAYTAAIGLLVMLAAMGTNVDRRRSVRSLVANGAILAVSAVVPIALMSSELLTGAGLLIQNFSRLLGDGGVGTTDAGTDIRTTIDSVTIITQQDWTGYLAILLKPYNLLLTVAALAGAVAGVWRKERWSVILAAAAVFFLLVVSGSDRGASERYLLAIAPAVWLLGSRGVDAFANGRGAYRTSALGLIAAVPLFFVVRDDFTLSRPDTRVLAKNWIEANVPSGSRILMDGMRFRFVQSPPLRPGPAAVARRLDSLESSELTLSGEMLSLYRTAAERVTGPTYDLYSTVYGLEVQDLDHYVRECVQYIVISSYHEKRFTSDASRERYPVSAEFYRQIRSDPRFEVVYAVRPASWKQAGPELTVYRVHCGNGGGNDWQWQGARSQGVKSES